MRWSTSPPEPWRALATGVALWLGGLLLLTREAWGPDAVIGHPASDVWKHLWGDAWFQRELFTAWPVPTRTTLIGFPDGGLLYNLDPLTGLFAWATQAAVPLTVSHDVAQVAGLLLGGVGGWALARRLGVGAWHALVAGSVVAFAPHLQAVVLVSGVGEAAHVGWVPLALVALDRAWTEDGRRGWAWAAAGAACLALAALGSWYYGLVASLGSATLVAWRAMSGGRRWRGRLARLLASGAASLVLVLPFALAFRDTLGGDALHTVAAVGVDPRDLLPAHNPAVATLRDLLVPGEPRLRLHKDRLVFVNHPGLVPLALALAAALRGSWRLGLVGVVAWSLVLGPTVHWDAGSPLVPNPVFRAFTALWPASDAVKSLERFQLAFTLVLGVLAGRGASLLPGPPALMGTGLAALVFLDGAWAGGQGLRLPAADATVPALLRTLPAPGALIVLPATDGPAGEPYWHQVAHGQPLALNLEGHPARSLGSNGAFALLHEDPSLGVFFQEGRPRRDRPELLASDHEALLRAGFRWVLLLDRAGPEDDLDVLRARRALERLGLARAGRQAGVELFDLAR